MHALFRRTPLLPLILSLFALPSQAEDRALLIGIGDYLHNPPAERTYLSNDFLLSDLSGIDKDMYMMQDIATAWGFQNITSLSNEQATLGNIRAQIQQLLIDGVQPTDRILLYFSGHGSRVIDHSGDEADGKDEILVLYDTLEVDTSEGKRLKNILLDDELGEWLAKIPSQQVWVIIDACHSGSSTRSSGYDAQGRVKVLGQYKAVSHHENPYINPANSQSMTLFDELEQVNYLALSASSDSESSLATENGSLFTQGLYRSVFSSTYAHKPLTALNWLQQSSQYIGENTGNMDRFAPQISGNKALLNRPLQFAISPQLSDANNTATLEQVLSKSTSHQERLTVQVFRENQPNHRDFMLGDYIRFKVRSDQSGYVYLFEKADNGQVRLLYPNLWAGDNYLQAGATLDIPQAHHDHALIIKDIEANGKNQYFVLQTPSLVNVFTLADKPLDDQGQRYFRRLLSAANIKIQSKGNVPFETRTTLAQQVLINSCTQYRDQRNKRC